MRDKYRGAAPFPHVVIDGLFPAQLLDSVLVEMAAMAQHQWLLVETGSHERIRRMNSGVELGAAGYQLVGLVHSAAFLYLLSEITGVWQLLPDPYLQGAGYASMKPGDFFNIHSDRNVAYETGLTRRLAMIVFLNKSWDRNYNGQLETVESRGDELRGRHRSGVQPNRALRSCASELSWCACTNSVPCRPQPAILHRLLPYGRGRWQDHREAPHVDLRS